MTGGVVLTLMQAMHAEALLSNYVQGRTKNSERGGGHIRDYMEGGGQIQSGGKAFVVSPISPYFFSSTFPVYYPFLPSFFK